jgi:hypothetical protein
MMDNRWTRCPKVTDKSECEEADRSRMKDEESGWHSIAPRGPDPI